MIPPFRGAVIPPFIKIPYQGAAPDQQHQRAQSRQHHCVNGRLGDRREDAKQTVGFLIGPRREVQQMTSARHGIVPG